MPRTTSRLTVPTCPFCGGPAPRRYPGNDPECGPAVPTCKSAECAATLKASEARDIADGVALVSVLVTSKMAGGAYRAHDVHHAIDSVIALAPRFKRHDVAISSEEEILCLTGLMPPDPYPTCPVCECAEGLVSTLVGLCCPECAAVPRS